MFVPFPIQELSQAVILVEGMPKVSVGFGTLHFRPLKTATIRWGGDADEKRFLALKPDGLQLLLHV